MVDVAIDYRQEKRRAQTYPMGSQRPGCSARRPHRIRRRRRRTGDRTGGGRLHCHPTGADGHRRYVDPQLRQQGRRRCGAYSSNSRTTCAWRCFRPETDRPRPSGGRSSTRSGRCTPDPANAFEVADPRPEPAAPGPDRTGLTGHRLHAGGGDQSRELRRWGRTRSYSARVPIAERCSGCAR